ncbi:beta-1,6-N-acetylglucosaminyltransferase [Halobacillus sp. Nhm2S1]|uniref:beta-1,6-N-acetylglucosaminyltransferase n=1 Tax=Halobacillus sp. Nhm2S1 TaxID=2866716 RepID=UPI001C72EDF5|nr:beta-1,6-N-acetylglucosaminyltransferase [Halobacillus sp. Nhm2S1]MBX0357719.1 hypothetical protein [Halobacillus sp. Nhm2S1]
MKIESNGINNKKFAILIIAHKNFKQLKRLVEKINHKNIDIFIHIDEKWDLSESKINELLSVMENIYFPEDRISANLSDWSLIEVTMSLIKKTKEIEEEKGIQYSYTMLISGQDYPIKPVNALVEELNNSYPKPFIDCQPCVNKNWVYKLYEKLPIEIKLNKDINQYMKKGLKRKMLKTPLYIFFKFLRFFIVHPYKELKNLNCSVYGGSSWWILPDIVIDDIYTQYYESNNRIISIFKKSLTPEETFFQTLTMRTSVSEYVTINFNNKFTRDCNDSLIYPNFYDEKKPYMGHPHILTVEDFDKISKLHHYFARKFDDSIDYKILDLIDEYLL